MARFTNLFQLGQVLADILMHHGGVTNAEVGVPLESPNHNQELVRLTLLWVTPQPTHVNDPPFRAADGTLEPPPITLSAFFLFTAYGDGGDGTEPEGAYNMLGKVLQTFHTLPNHELPDAELPNAPDWGEGPLSIIQVPTAADLMEKVYTPLQVKHRPWVLYEVGPVQLVNLEEPEEGAPLVRPGGPTLAGVEVLGRPAIERITPERPGRGGRMRLDGTWGGPVEEVRVGEVSLSPGDPWVATVDGSVIVRLPHLVSPTVEPGEHPVKVRVGKLFSEPCVISVQGSEVPTIFAPESLAHDPATELLLEGRNLESTSEVYLWPDAGVAAPDEVAVLTVDEPGSPVEVSATEIRLGPAAFTDLSARTYRISARISPRVYTPYVLVELRP